MLFRMDNNKETFFYTLGNFNGNMCISSRENTLGQTPLLKMLCRNLYTQLNVLERTSNLVNI